MIFNRVNTTRNAAFKAHQQLQDEYAATENIRRFKAILYKN